jgi:hypothetical protein
LHRVSSSVDVKRIGWPQIYLGVGFTTLATLVLYLSLTRIFSVVFFYRFAFLAISIALLGLAAGGFFSYLVVARKAGLFVKLGTLAALNSLAVVLSLVFLLTRHGEFGTITKLLICLAAAMPFLLSGATISLVLAETIQRVDRIYCIHLLGAAAGCLALVPFLNYLGGPNTVIAAAVLFAVSSAIWFHCAASVVGRAAAVVLALLLVALIAYNGRSHLIDVQYAKGHDLPPETFSKWNTFSRIGLTARKTITIDGEAAADISPSDFKLPTAPSLPYILRPGAKTLVIGTGGAGHAAQALYSGSKDLTVVETNPIVANNIMRGSFAVLSQGLYLRPEVRVYVEDGRSFVRRSIEKYQVLLVDAQAAPSALSPNNLYTTEAFHDDGLLALTGSGFEPPRGSLRILSLAYQAFDDIGERDLASHVVVLRANVENLGTRDTMLIFRKPISTDDRAKIRNALERTKVELVYAPGMTAGTLLSPDPQASPVSDDRPFFFYTAGHALPLLLGLAGIGILATAAVLTLPPFLFKAHLPIEKGVRSFIWYFVCLGAGYILIQVALTQKFTLLLGHPTYGLTVIVFSMLIFSAVGSFYSRRLIADASSRWSLVLIGITALAAALAFVAAPIAESSVGLPLPLKMLITVLLIAPIGFLMGVPFPAGLTRLESRYPHAVRWAWAVNAASGVLGLVGAIFLAIHLGLRLTLPIGGALYLVALVVARIESKQECITDTPIHTNKEALSV